MIMSLYRDIDRKQLQFDFAVNDSEREYAYEQEIRQLGGRVYRLPVLSLKNIKRYKISWSELLENHPEWKVVHIHHTSTAPVSIPLAKKAGRTTIAHSHTAGSDGSLKSRLKFASRYPVRHLADHLLACSAPSAPWIFGSKSRDTVVLNNAIDVESFLPDKKVRDRVRAEVGFKPSQQVIGQVGRFMEVKHHTVMLDGVQALVQKDPGVAMVLVGDGPLKTRVLEQAERMGVADNVVFTGVRSDISDLMQAMDAFIFPSLHEGLPVTLVEAQASGLSCLVSDTVSQDVKLTDCIEFMSLNASADRWAERLLAMCAQGQRPDNRHELSAAGYDVQDNARWLENFYHKITESA